MFVQILSFSVFLDHLMCANKNVLPTIPNAIFKLNELIHVNENKKDSKYVLKKRVNGNIMPIFGLN